MSEKENPAKRLYEILLKMREENSGPTRLVLAEALGMEDRPLNEILEAALEFYALFDDTMDALREEERISEALYIEPIKELRNAIPITSLDAPWVNYRAAINAVNMRSLAHAIFELDRRPLPPAIEPDTLEAFYDDVGALYERIEESDLPDELRREILEMLYAILKAIRLHAARGAKPLKHALLLNAGTLVTNWQLFERYEQTEEVKGYTDAVDRLIKIIPVAADSTTLLSAGWQAVKALLSGGSQP